MTVNVGKGSRIADLLLLFIKSLLTVGLVAFKCLLPFIGSKCLLFCGDLIKIIGTETIATGGCGRLNGVHCLLGTHLAGRIQEIGFGLVVGAVVSNCVGKALDSVGVGLGAFAVRALHLVKIFTEELLVLGRRCIRLGENFVKCALRGIDLVAIGGAKNAADSVHDSHISAPFSCRLRPLQHRTRTCPSPASPASW